MKAAIYARVSTKDKGQDVQNQLMQLKRYAAAQGWEVAEYIDHESGKHSDRDAFRKMFAAAAAREVDVVLVWALDRLTREGVWVTFDHIRKLTSYGVQFESLTEAHFRTTGPAGELMIAIAAWIAKQERARISERTKAGMARVMAQGKHVGRPKAVFKHWRVIKLRDAGLSWTEISRKMRIPASTLRSAIRD